MIQFLGHAATNGSLTATGSDTQEAGQTAQRLQQRVAALGSCQRRRCSSPPNQVTGQTGGAPGIKPDPAAAIRVHLNSGSTDRLASLWRSPLVRDSYPVLSVGHAMAYEMRAGSASMVGQPVSRKAGGVTA
jgi:hypothetical protein